MVDLLPDEIRFRQDGDVHRGERLELQLEVRSFASPIVLRAEVRAIDDDDAGPLISARLLPGPEPIQAAVRRLIDDGRHRQLQRALTRRRTR